MLAGGTLNGEVYLWNVYNEDPFLCKSDLDDYYHRESVTKIVWIKT